MDEREHHLERSCWCEPLLWYTTEEGVEIWLHRTPVPPPPDVMFAAMASAVMDDDA